MIDGPKADVMALNLDRVGHAYDSWVYEVSRAKIHEYAQALGETDPRYLSDGPDCVAPPTFVAAFTVMRPAEALMADEDLGFHMNLVHGSQAYRWGERPLRPGDRITCTPSIADITRRRGSELLTMTTECLFEDGSLAVESTTVLVLLGSAPAEGESA